MKYILIISLLIIQALQLQAQLYRCNMPWVDLSSDYTRQTVIAKGTPSLYNGHPTTLLLDDQRTVFCVWSNGHGGKASFMGISEDAGMNWKVHKTPTDWQNMSNCPSIYRMTDKKGKQRLFIFCGSPNMGYSYSEDNGKSWSKVKSLGKPCVMAFTSIVRLNNGDYMGFYHRGYKDRDQSPLTLWSEGKLPDELTIDALKGKHSSHPRNILLASVFYKAGFIETWGRGISKICNAFKAIGIEEPVFKQSEGGMLVTFKKNYPTMTNEKSHSRTNDPK